MLRALLTLSLALGAAYVAAEIYQSRDAEGRVTYSDRPGDQGAEPVQLPTTNTTPAVEPRKRPADKGEGDAAPNYRVSIVSPAADAVIPNGLVPLQVQISVEPPLREGDSLQLLVDGSEFATAEGTSFSIPQLSRGAHTLRAQALYRGRYPRGSSAEHSIFVYWPGNR